MSILAILDNVGFTNDYSDVIDFESIEAQTSYFDSKRAFILDDLDKEFTFIRPNYELKVAVPYLAMLGYNYCYFTNVVKGKSKRYYAFITSIEYINQNTTRLLLQVDVMQTFMFDYRLKECYVDREHQNRFTRDDNDNIIPVYSLTEEGVDYGKDYIERNRIEIFDRQTPHYYYGSIAWVWINTSEPLEGHVQPNIVGSEFGLRTPIYTYCTPVDIRNNMAGVTRYAGTDDNDNYAGVNTIVNNYGSNPKIMSILITPYCPFTLNVANKTDDTGALTGYKIEIQNAKQLDLKGVKLMYVDYLPADINNLYVSHQKDYIFEFDRASFIKNEFNLALEQRADKENETKLYTDPYFYYSLGNQQNTPKTFKNEYLRQGSRLRYIQNIGPTTKEKLYFEGYKGGFKGYFECTLNNVNNDMPLTSDAYKQYITQNKASSIAGVAVPIVSTIAGIALAPFSGGLSTALIAGGVLSVGATIANDIAKRQDLKQTPDTIRTSGNNIVFDILAENFFYNLTAFSISDEAQQRLYKYFMHFGYKCSCFKIPNTKSRYYYNYIRNISTLFDSDLDQQTLQTIKDVYTNGVTLWHYHNAETWHGVGNYEFENVETALI